jgi:hypothetical protein
MVLFRIVRFTFLTIALYRVFQAEGQCYWLLTALTPVYQVSAYCFDFIPGRKSVTTWALMTGWLLQDG